ncbi:MAG: PD-(D/E)XK nuclease family protein [Candidatus Falkowbacteria bacterium]
MSQYYNGKRSKNFFEPDSTEPFKLSRSRIDLFMNCPRCFYIDRRLGVDRPPGFPFNLNSAVDKLLKKEFDVHRAGKTVHPLVKAYGLDLVPLQNKQMDEWRENFKGVQYLHPATNFLVTGAVDDLWVDEDGLVYVVDYKATSKDEQVSLDAGWQIGYKRQMEIYQWLLRHNGYQVSDTGYFVYCNGRTDRAAFDGQLEFEVTLIPYTGDDGWVESALKSAHKCLTDERIPKANPDCDYCQYIAAVQAAVESKSK